MAIAAATQDQIQVMRNALLRSAKLVDEVLNGGKSNIATMASTIDDSLAACKAVLDAVVAAKAS